MVKNDYLFIRGVPLYHGTVVDLVVSITGGRTDTLPYEFLLPYHIAAS
jgi:hypothetical protein